MFVTKDLLKKITNLETYKTESETSRLIQDKMIEKLREDKHTIEQSLLNIENRMNELEITLKEYIEYKKKKEGDEPYIELVGNELSTEYGLAVKLDWNPAMINYLKRNGYTGTTDEEIVQKYLADMMNDKAKHDNDIR